MILRRNQNGSWKLRVRVYQDPRKVAQLMEIGLHTRSLKIALRCTLTVSRLYTSLGVVRDTHIRISDPEHAASYSIQEVKKHGRK